MSLPVDTEVGAKFNLINLQDNKLSADDLRKALLEIRHCPSEKNLDVLIGKLDADGDGFIPLEDIKLLIEGEGLGVSCSTVFSVLLYTYTT